MIKLPFFGHLIYECTAKKLNKIRIAKCVWQQTAIPTRFNDQACINC